MASTRGRKNIKAMALTVQMRSAAMGAECKANPSIQRQGTKSRQEATEVHEAGTQDYIILLLSCLSRGRKYEDRESAYYVRHGSSRRRLIISFTAALEAPESVARPARLKAKSSVPLESKSAHGRENARAFASWSDPPNCALQQHQSPSLGEQGYTDAEPDQKRRDTYSRIWCFQYGQSWPPSGPQLSREWRMPLFVSTSERR